MIPPDIPAPQLAVALLGQTLMSTTGGLITAVINETEAYTYYDKSCHGYGNKQSERNAPLFLAAGRWYVYFTYGMHYCANISAEPEGMAGGVLIRGLTVTHGLPLVKARRGAKIKDNQLTNGPAKICKALNIDKSFNGSLATDSNTSLHLNFTAHFPCCHSEQLDDFTFKRSDGLIYKITPRIGLGGNHEDINRLWRFVIA